MEAAVNRLAFLCPDGCRGWEHHGNATITYLTEVIDAEFYEVPAPDAPATGVEHLDHDIVRHLDRFRRQWTAETAA